VFRCSHLDHHFLKPGGFVDVSSSPALCSKCWAAECLSKGCTEYGKRSRCKFAAVPAVMYSILFCSSSDERNVCCCFLEVRHPVVHHIII
jgi:hypothetical protein